MQDASLALAVPGPKNVFVRLHPAPVHWMAQKFRAVFPVWMAQTAVTVLPDPSDTLQCIASVDSASRPYVEALVRIAQRADHVLTEQEALRAAGKYDEARDMGGDILEESVAVMSALRLLHREGKSGAQLSDYLVYENVFFPVLDKRLRDPRKPEMGMTYATRNEMKETIKAICQSLLQRHRSGHNTCFICLAKHNAAVDGCQFAAGGPRPIRRW